MTAVDFGGEASQRVWGLVCGYPAERREARRLLMLQAYMDESEQGDYFVLAGYVASVPAWAAFSDEWHALLHHGSHHFPRLDEFKMSEMHDTEARMEMVPWFYRVIEKYVEFGLEMVIPVSVVRSEYENIEWPEWMDRPERYKNPYLIAFRGLFDGLRSFGSDLGIAEKVDFIFDKRLHDDDLCREAWSEMSKDQGFKDLCGEDPQFRDSKLNLPLQAADFIAYWAREWAKKGERPTTGNLPFPWWEAVRQDITTLAQYLDVSTLRSDWEYWIKQEEAERAGKPLPPKYRINSLREV